MLRKRCSSVPIAMRHSKKPVPYRPTAIQLMARKSLLPAHCVTNGLLARLISSDIDKPTETWSAWRAHSVGWTLTALRSCRLTYRCTTQTCPHKSTWPTCLRSLAYHKGRIGPGHVPITQGDFVARETCPRSWACCQGDLSQVMGLLPGRLVPGHGPVARETCPRSWACCQGDLSQVMGLLPGRLVPGHGPVVRETCPRSWACCQGDLSQVMGLLSGRLVPGYGPVARETCPRSWACCQGDHPIHTLSPYSRRRYHGGLYFLKKFTILI